MNGLNHLTEAIGSTGPVISDEEQKFDFSKIRSTFAPGMTNANYLPTTFACASVFVTRMHPKN